MPVVSKTADHILVGADCAVYYSAPNTFRHLTVRVLAFIIYDVSGPVALCRWRKETKMEWRMLYNEKVRDFYVIT